MVMARVAGFFFTRGKASTRFVAKATQSRRNGHEAHDGLRGVQTSAPISIRPWLKSRGDVDNATSSAAWLHALSSSANRRARTRATLPSTIGARCPNAIEAIAPAV